MTQQPDDSDLPEDIGAIDPDDPAEDIELLPPPSEGIDPEGDDPDAGTPPTA